MKFIAKDGTTVIANEKFSLFSKDVSPFKEILQRKDFSDYVFENEKTIPFSEVTQIQVNVVEIGIMAFVFEKEGFVKEDFINEVSKLRELPISTFYDVLNKIKALYQVAEAFNPLFVIYNPVGKYKIYDSCFETINSNIKTIYICNNQADINNATEFNLENNSSKEDIANAKTAKKKSFQFVNPFPIIIKDKFHFLFALIATFLIGFTIGIGIHDAYAGKMLCIFFFICATAGAFLNFMIYRDTFKSNKINNFYSLLTLFASIIGVALSIGAYYLFKAISKDDLVISPHIMMIIAIVIGVFLLSACISYLTIYIKNRKK